MTTIPRTDVPVSRREAREYTRPTLPVIGSLIIVRVESVILQAYIDFSNGERQVAAAAAHEDESVKWGFHPSRKYPSHGNVFPALLSVLGKLHEVALCKFREIY